MTSWLRGACSTSELQLMSKEFSQVTKPYFIYRPDGTKEMSTYDENGSHTGPAKLIWANGAVREGQKVNGKWHGEVFYTYAEGPRKGKRDKETWVNGELKSTKKLYDKVLCSQLL